MANDFSTDPSCKALWRFEPSAIHTDSIGGNTLTTSAVAEEVGEATAVGTYKEGSGAAILKYPSWTDRAYLFINSADLDAGFPLQTGDATKQISIAGWFYLDVDQGSALTGHHLFYTLAGSSDKSVAIGFDGTYDEFNMRFRVAGAVQDVLTSGASLSKQVWYHFGLAVDGIAKTYLLRVYNATTSTATTYSGALNNELTVGDGRIDIGRTLCGTMDELVVFADAKTADDFDDIRAGTYEYVAPVNLVVANAHHTHSAETPFMGTLEVQGSHHVLWSTTLWPINLIVANAYHALASPDLNTVLSVQSAAHVSASDALTITQLWPGNLINGLLPGIQLTAQTGKRLYLTRPLPGLQLTAWSGARLSERLPTMEISATSSHESLMTGSGRLSEMRIEARSASRADALKLPTLEGSASVQAFLTGSLDRRLPGIQITAEGASARIGVLTGTLPTLESSLIATAEMLMSLDSQLPVLRGSALASLATTIDLDALLPALGMTGGNVVDGTMSLSGTLPTIVASVMVNALTEDEPAVEYHILRHVR